MAAGEGFRCDGIGCTAQVKGVTISIAKHPAALADDCAHAAILILDVPRPRWCSGPLAVIDVFALKIGGAHAVYIDGPGRVRVVTARDQRGTRPWSMPPAWARDRAKPQPSGALNTGG